MSERSVLQKILLFRETIESTITFSLDESDPAEPKFVRTHEYKSTIRQPAYLPFITINQTRTTSSTIGSADPGMAMYGLINVSRPEVLAELDRAVEQAVADGLFTAEAAAAAREKELRYRL